ncbi:O-antigen ligase family protein [Aquimarina sp. 2304DJ70-9]|uniref:O-antigen ligase family protein n=1 Tax=Aquimarina penaris TaxID=3231044 RepID=UPI0034628478
MEFVKTYMLLTVFLGLIFISFIKIQKLYEYEIIWLLLLFYLALTIVYSDDYTVAIKAIIGEVILIVFYFLYRFFLNEIGIDRYTKILTSLGKWYLIVALLLYFLGFYFYYLKGIRTMPLFYTDQEYRVLGAMFNKWTGMPRLVGPGFGVDSFNWMSSFFIIVFWINKNYKWLIIGVICSLLTFSITFLLVLALVIVYFIIKKGKLFSMLMALAPVVGIVFYYYKTNDWFNNIIESRITSAQSGTGRFDIWSFIFEKIWERPFFGHGINQLKVHLETYSDKSIRSAHNTLIEIFFNSGIIGVFLYVIFILGFYLACYNVDRKNGSIYFRVLFLCYFVFSMANTSIYNFSTLLFFSFVFLYTHTNHLKKAEQNEN